eukprot:TRINITY_DN47090_c0_g1_i1.p1 TRINITY_DN47090_c0_g1~~TRINITY_DN47090_c0_g1_i1.p1  ORF type:complete len:359 (+),score=79.86 TRINITY_DN47090_c0_g1_i1:70-1146(+)
MVAAAAVLAAAAAAAVFEVRHETWGNGTDALRAVVLANTQSGESIEIVPELGGRVEGLRLRSRDGRMRDVLCDHNRSVHAIRANVGFRGAMLMPYANRMANGSFTLNGKRYYMDRNEDRGKYGRCGLHGYLVRHAMTVESEAADDTMARAKLAYTFGSDPGYPWALRVEIEYTLSQSGVSFAVTATNTEASQPLPFYNGWHPYFAMRDMSRSTVRLDPCTRWNHISMPNNSNIDSSLIPTGLTTPFSGFDGSAPIGGTAASPTYWDDEFKATADPATDGCGTLRTTITDDVDRQTMVLWQDRSYRWFQVYSGTMFSQNKSAVAMEPMSGQADAWNSGQGMRLIQAGERWSGSFGVYMQ